MGTSEMRDLAADPRWSGAPDRLEVFYATFTDPESGTGVWVHHETVAPPLENRSHASKEGDAAGLVAGSAEALGWVSIFPPQGPPVTERFGPVHVTPSDRGDGWFSIPGVTATDGHWEGRAGAIDWNLDWSDTGGPLWTFARQAWQRELLPSAQVVIAPTATFTGTIGIAGHDLVLDHARGAVSHIYGHGNAKRWAWLHADLGGGDVLEVVTAVSRTPGLDRLPPLAFLRFRIAGAIWPGSALPALGVHTNLGLEHWELTGRIGARRIRVSVDQPLDRCVSLDYYDPDGAHAVCTNTERADVDITIEAGRGANRHIERHWHLSGTGHSEVGLRGDDAPDADEMRPETAALHDD